MSTHTAPKTSSRRRLGILLFTLAAGISVAIAPFVGSEPQLPPSVSTAPSAHAVASADPCRAPGEERVAAAIKKTGKGLYGAAPGTTFTFRLDDRNTYNFTGKDTNHPQPAKTHVEATVVMEVLDRRDDEVAVRATMSSLQFLDAQGQAFVGDEAADRFVAAAKQPAILRLGADGGISCYRFADRMDGEQRNFLRGMLVAFVFTGPTDDAAEWSAQEMDTTGVFDARYERLPSAAGETRLRRSKLRYVSMNGQKEVMRHELKGHALARFSAADAWLTEAAFEEHMVCDFGLLDLKVDHQRRVRIELCGVEHGIVSKDVAAIWDGEWSSPSGDGEKVPDRAQQTEERQWRQKLAGVDLLQLIAQLREVLAANPVDRGALDDMFLRMQWLTKFDPRVVDAIAVMIATDQLSGSVANVALGALGAAGSPEAQRALLAVRANASLSGELRDAAAMAMLQLETPVPELIQSLADAANETDANGQCALLALGALAPRCRKLGDGVDSIARLLAIEGSIGSGEGLATWLRAVGNSGVPEAVSIAARHFDSQDTQVRAASCDAVRRVEAAASTQFLIERGLSDEAPEVRRSAIAALARRAGAGAALRNAAAYDTDIDVRAAAVSALAEGPLDAADRAVLEQIAAADVEERLRTMAERLLRGE